MSQSIRETSAAVRLAFHWFGQRRTLTKDQRNEAAHYFGAEDGSVSGSKTLFTEADRRSPEFKRIQKAKSAIRSHWEGRTLPYPDNGIRLLNHAKVAAFIDTHQELVRELDAAVDALVPLYPTFIDNAKAHKGRLFNPNDYPATLAGSFVAVIDFPNLEPPSYLMELNPAQYEVEKARAAARYEEAVNLAVQEHGTALADVMSKLLDRLATGEDGQRKSVSTAAVENVSDAVKNFRELFAGQHAGLDAVAQQLENAMSGVDVKALRTDDDLRATVQEKLAVASEALNAAVVLQPRRRIVGLPEETPE